MYFIIKKGFSILSFHIATIQFIKKVIHASFFLQVFISHIFCKFNKSLTKATQLVTIHPTQMITVHSIG